MVNGMVKMHVSALIRTHNAPNNTSLIARIHKAPNNTLLVALAPINHH
jgi:hypothetical protein